MSCTGVRTDSSFGLDMPDTNASSTEVVVTVIWNWEGGGFSLVNQPKLGR